MNQEHNQTISPEEQIKAAMKILEQSEQPTSPDSNNDETENLMAQGSTSPTLDALDISRRPKAKTICEACPNSMWLVGNRITEM